MSILCHLNFLSLHPVPLEDADFTTAHASDRSASLAFSAKFALAFACRASRCHRIRCECIRSMAEDSRQFGRNVASVLSTCGLSRLTRHGVPSSLERRAVVLHGRFCSAGARDDAMFGRRYDGVVKRSGTALSVGKWVGRWGKLMYAQAGR